MLAQCFIGTSKEMGSAWGGREGDQRETTRGKGMGREFPGDYSPVGKFGATCGVIFF